MGVSFYIIIGALIGMCVILGVIWGEISEIKKLLKKDKNEKGDK